MADSQKSNKDTVIRARVDRETVEQLEYIEKKTNRKKSAAIRDGIQKIYDEITK